MFCAKFFISIILVFFAEQAIAQHNLDFVIPPCPYVGIGETVQPSASIRAFPQPAINELTIEFEDLGIAEGGIIELSMYHIMGRLVIWESVSPGVTKTRLDVTDCPPGVYLLQIRLNKEYHSRRIIVVKE